MKLILLYHQHAFIFIIYLINICATVYQYLSHLYAAPKWSYKISFVNLWQVGLRYVYPASWVVSS